MEMVAVKSYQPKKMPASIAGKYRELADLRRLFSSILSKSQRASVCDALVLSLSRRHGVVYFDWNGLDVPAASMRDVSGMHTVEFVNLLFSTSEYGDKESISYELANIMQPYWSNWWSKFDLRSEDLASYILECVLGDQQILWISAQIARRSIRFSGEASPTLTRAIALVEDWILGRAQRRDLEPFKKELDDCTDSVDVSNEAPSASRDAVLTFFVEALSSPAAKVFQMVVQSSSYAEGFSLDMDADDEELNSNIASARICCANVARKIFTPTLITHASQGLR